MTNTQKLWALSVLILLMGLSAGCGGTKPSRFYTLTSMPPAEQTAAPATTAHETVLGLGPVTFPDYLLRPPIATYAGTNQIYYAEFDRWAEPLGDNFARVLGDNLSGLLGTEYIALYPWQPASEITYQVAVDVTGFELRTDGEIWLVARWRIVHRQELETLSRHKSEFHQAFAYEKKIDYGELTRVMSTMVAELSREIAAEIRALPEFR